jgi:four helix bundle protein
MTNQGKKPYDIRERAFAYALDAIKLYRTFQEKKDGAGWVIAKQFLRSATSIGANIEEAQAAESRADFVHKYGIAQREARESSYWLRLLEASSIHVDDAVQSMLKETNELTAIITTIIVNAKKNRK